MLRKERGLDQIRNLNFEIGVNKYAEGSCLVSLGETRVMVTASVENKVPTHLKGGSKGWVTAEYSMLPRATGNRTYREGRRKNLDGRTQEIQRLIGRSLRAVTRLENLGPRTIWIDCDVLQADGGTRTASIMGGFIAYYEAIFNMMKRNQIKANPIEEPLAAISVGIVQNHFMVDLEYQEDLIADVDLNIVATKSEKIIEVQGTAEGLPFTRDELNDMISLGLKGIHQALSVEEQAITELKKRFEI